METSKLFREAKNELQEIFGNVYLCYDINNGLMPETFTGLLSTRLYKNYMRRIVCTTAAVPFLTSGTSIAISGFPEVKLRVFENEPHILQNQLTYYNIYCTNADEDPIHKINSMFP